MRVAVIGAGAIGGGIASLLAEAGHDVEVTARGANLAAIREHGVRRRGEFGTATVRLDANETLTARPALAILATKATDAEAAIAANVEQLRQAPLLVIQNGLGGERRAAEQLGHDRVAGGLALSAVNSLEAGVVEVTAAGDTVIGGAAAADFLSLFAGAVPRTVETTDLEGAQWTKLIINMVNALPAVTDFSVQETIATPALLRVLLASLRETSRVGRALHVDFQPIAGFTPVAVRVLALAPRAIAASIPRRFAEAMGPTPNLGSTLQSIRRGARTEIDYLNGAVVEAGVRAGMPTPVNAGLVRLVHEVEETGQFPPLEAVFALAP